MSLQKVSGQARLFSIIIGAIAGVFIAGCLHPKAKQAVSDVSVPVTCISKVQVDTTACTAISSSLMKCNDVIMHYSCVHYHTK